jgi:glucose-6-phosphate dehydrogenase assembly protein OpcA
VDSSKFKDPIRSLARLSAFWESRFPNTLLMDLNWIRVQRWRALIAELFDGEWAGHLKGVNKVSVAYGEGSSPTRGFYIACWLASRMGWKYKGERISTFPPSLSFEGPQGPVEAVLKSVPVQDAKRDRIFAVGLVTRADQAGVFTVMRDQDPHCVIAKSEIGGKPAFSRTVSFEHFHSNEVLNNGMKHLRPDPCWDQTLRMAGTILVKPDLTKV